MLILMEPSTLFSACPIAVVNSNIAVPVAISQTIGSATVADWKNDFKTLRIDELKRVGEYVSVSTETSA